jgi:hypothetical protein
MKVKSLFVGTLALLFILGISASMSYAKEYDQVGVLTCGDLWETVSPCAIENYDSEKDEIIATNWECVRFGNIERAWGTPTTMYPGGDIVHLPWGTSLVMVEYSNIDNFNNYTTDSDVRAKNYVSAITLPNLDGYTSAYGSSDNVGGVPWTDDARTCQLYEAYEPTNIGIDLNIRARAHTLNEANMNDWIAVEFQLTNTGIQDIDCDGNIERENHKIEALSLAIRSEVIGCMRSSSSGGRWGPGTWPVAYSGYDATPDADGNPWAMNVHWATAINPSYLDDRGWAPDGQRKVSYRLPGNLPALWDVWNGWCWIAVKEGGINGGYSATDKKTIYDSHPIGEGIERGFYSTSNRGWGNASTAAYLDFLVATGTWYEDGGRTWTSDNLITVKPDPNWFDTTQDYTAGDPLSFVDIVKPEGQRSAPQGDSKHSGYWLQNWERNFEGLTPDPKIPAEDEWLDGGTSTAKHGFDGDRYAGIGPFSLEVGETMTAVVIDYAGYRLQGARQALKSARWAYENGWNIPKPPPMPDMKVQPMQLDNGDFACRIIWDSAAEAADDFAGYKIYRVTGTPDVDYTKFGSRFLDNYHHQTAADIGISNDELAAKYSQPINPNNSVTPDWYYEWDPGPQGPWKIMAYITKAELGSYANDDEETNTEYPYVWIDTDDEVSFGRTYWYYVAAFDNESGEMAGISYTSLESSRDNWNGRDGRWSGCYPHAFSADEYPDGDAAAMKYLGADFVLSPSRVDAKDLLSGEMKVRVKPNPYKVASPYETGLEHEVLFYNLTSDTRITILDLAGQIMDVLEYEGADPQDGSMYWDLFTKDGSEVPSGLYIWLAEYPGGKQKGYLAIMR